MQAAAARTWVFFSVSLSLGPWPVVRRGLGGRWWVRPVEPWAGGTVAPAKPEAAASSVRSRTCVWYRGGANPWRHSRCLKPSWPCSSSWPLWGGPQRVTRGSVISRWTLTPIPYNQKETINTCSYQTMFEFKTAGLCERVCVWLFGACVTARRLTGRAETPRAEFKTEQFRAPLRPVQWENIPCTMHISHAYCSPVLSVERQHISYWEI